jgi:hypothetical protein
MPHDDDPKTAEDFNRRIGMGKTEQFEKSERLPRDGGGKYTIRLRYRILGGHTHIKIYSGKTGGTLGCAGDFIMTNDEFQAWKERNVILEFFGEVES